MANLNAIKEELIKNYIKIKLLEAQLAGINKFQNNDDSYDIEDEINNLYENILITQDINEEE